MSIVSSTPAALYRAAEVRELDRRAIEDEGIEGYTLMCRAGQALTDELVQRFPSCRRVSIVCGRGNNAGDGYVVARLVTAIGLGATIEQLGRGDGLTGDAATARRDAIAAGVRVVEHDGDVLSVDRWGDVIVDALLGTGVTRPLAGLFKAAVDAMNTSGRPVVAVDLPSGLSADTGAVLGVAVHASMTVTFIGRKRGLATGAAADHCGELVFADLAVPAAVYAGMPGIRWQHFEPERLPARLAISHKHMHGHVVVIGGDRPMGGAVSMAAEAALRAGAGLVTVATRADHRVALLARTPEVMVADADDDKTLSGILERAGVFAFGPGIGRGDWSHQLFDRVADDARGMVVDADGLAQLAARPERSGGERILTPHPGEAALLLGSSTAQVQSDRFSAALEVARCYRATVILKGAGTVVADETGRTVVCRHGNPGMASAGMGDVLTGVVAALWGQGLSRWDAAVQGACLHSAAGDRAAAELGQRGMIATDLMSHIASLLS